MLRILAESEWRYVPSARHRPTRPTDRLGVPASPPSNRSIGIMQSKSKFIFTVLRVTVLIPTLSTSRSGMGALVS